LAELEGVDPGTVAAGVSALELGTGISTVEVTAGRTAERAVGVGAVPEE